MDNKDLSDFTKHILREGQTINRIDSETDVGFVSLMVVFHQLTDKYFSITMKNGEVLNVLELE